MKTTFALLAVLAATTGGALAGELCTAVTDTTLYADAALTEEVRPIFQFDGAQFVPRSKDGDTLYGEAFDVRMQPMLEEPIYARAKDWACEGEAPDAPAPAAADAAGIAYDRSVEACGAEYSDTRVVVSDSALGFYESTCDVVERTEDGAGTARLTLQCYGEGEEWTVGAEIAETEAGLTLGIDGTSQSYVRCP